MGLKFDLSPIWLIEFIYDDYILKFDPIIKLFPELNETHDLICLYYNKLGIDVYGESRMKLIEALISDVDVCWRNYAKEDDEKLTGDAVELKYRLLAAIKEIPIGNK